jgi:hypothetical protein
MESKKINQLATNVAPVSTDLTIIGDPITGVSKKITLSQLAAVFSGAIAFYTNYAGFPATGVINTIYCAKDTQKLYLWSGSVYVETFPSQAVLDTYQLLSAKGVANGYASLDSGGKVPIAQLPSSIMEYKGMWNASTNTPTLANGTGDTGDVYICNVAGSVNFGAGVIVFAVGDYVIYSGSIWQRSSGAVGTVSSVGLSSATSGVTIGSSPITTSGTITLAIATATTSQNGLLSSTDWSTFNNKVPYTGATTDLNLGANLLKFTTEASDSATIGTTISGSSSYFDFNLSDDNNQEEWRFRFTPSGGSVYDAVRIRPVSATKSDLLVSGDIGASNFSGSSGGTNTGDVTIGTANGLSLASQVLSLATSSGSTTGALTSTDWSSFNSKVSSQWTTSGSDISYNTGNVCVNTTTSGVGRFFVAANNDSGITIRNTGTSDRFQLFVGSTGGATYTPDNAIIKGTNTDIDFYNGSTATKKVTIPNSGNYLEVYGDAYVQSYVKIGNGSGNYTALTTIASGTKILTFPNATGTVALTSDIPSLTGYVPYTGATTNLDLGANGLYGNNLTIRKISTSATIDFPNTGTMNDPGYIKHTESPDNTAVMSFSVGDNDATNDYFVFGNTSSGFVERFKITASGVVTIGTWNGTAIGDSYISSASTWNGKVSSVSATSPVVSSGGTTPTISMAAATTSVSGYLTSTDWTTFNNKGTFSLPSLTSGSVLFSNGSTIAQDNADFFWDATNNRLGIGNASPSYPLDVTGIIKGSTSIYATNDLYIGDTTGSATGRLIITDSSNQGVNIRRNNAVSERFKLFVGNGTTYTQDNAIILGTNTDIDFYTGSSPVRRLTIANNGNIGIGTNTPASQATGITTGILDVSNSSGGNLVLHRTGSGDTALFSIYKGSNGTYIDSTGAATAANNAIYFRNNNINADQTSLSTRLTIFSNGRIENSNAPANDFALTLNGSATTSQSYGLNIYAGTNSSDATFNVNNTSGTNYFKVRGDGLVRINGFITGYDGSSAQLQINGQTRSLGFTYHNAALPSEQVNVSCNGAGQFYVAGALSKNSGSFKIDHPLESMTDSHYLVHSFIEAPQADLYYRGKMVLVNGKGQANIDEIATMTEGTFEALCREVQCFTTNESGWDLVKGKVIGNIIYIESQNTKSSDEISWMVIGERKDKHMMDTSWTNENGKVIVEPLKPIETKTY